MAVLQLSEQEVVELKAALATRRRATSISWFHWISMGLIVALTALLAIFMAVDLILDLTS